MVPLPVANMLHHKVRSVLSALGVAIGVCMLVTLSGLARGSLGEVADRWDAVDADLIVYPARVGDNITTLNGAGLSAKDTDKIRALSINSAPAVEYVVPIFLYRISIKGVEYNVVGATPGGLPHLLGKGSIAAGGRSFDPDNVFANWLEKKLSTPAEGVLDISDAELAAHGGLEMVIDSRLAQAADLKVGSDVYSAGHTFTVVGVVPDGALARAFIPRATAEYLFNGLLGRYTLMFVKLGKGVRVGPAIQAVRKSKYLTAVAVNEYRGMLESRFGVMYLYVDAVNTVTLVVAFLFILVTLYTMVIQRSREIAILKSMGATRLFILRDVMAESIMLTTAGAAAGILMSPVAAAVIETVKPLLTVKITWDWVVTAVVAALVGGAVAAIYPAWCAMRVDVARTLSLE